ncbi:hypothetical protein AB0E06_00915 [Streptomyces sp. NPDC048109]|uniref:hypothetical protein n=1 Tax=Streptomyces sp. NPDC048109 TaxID=3155482 RepID=UPI00343CAC31
MPRRPRQYFDQDVDLHLKMALPAVGSCAAGPFGGHQVRRHLRRQDARHRL